MKKALSLILALVMCLSLCACGSNNSELEGRISALEKEIADMKSETNTTKNEQNTSGKQYPTEYVGEWKMKDISGTIYVLQLNADGTGSLDGSYSTDVIWEYNEKYNTIEFEMVYFNSTGSFAIKEKEGKTVLDDTIVFFGRDFYRSADFVE